MSQLEVDLEGFASSSSSTSCIQVSSRSSSSSSSSSSTLCVSPASVSEKPSAFFLFRLGLSIASISDWPWVRRLSSFIRVAHLRGLRHPGHVPSIGTSASWFPSSARNFLDRQVRCVTVKHVSIGQTRMSEAFASAFVLHTPHDCISTFPSWFLAFSTYSLQSSYATGMVRMISGIWNAPTSAQTSAASFGSSVGVTWMVILGGSWIGNFAVCFCHCVKTSLAKNLRFNGQRLKLPTPSR